MNARIIAFVACRLFAVYLFIMYGANAVLQLLIIALAPHQDNEAPIWHYAITAGAAASLYMVFAFGLWTGASLISRAISAPVPEKFEDKPAGSHWQAVVVSVIGWLSLLLALGYASHAIDTLTRPDRSYIDLPHLVLPGLVYLVLGGSLTLFPASLVRGLEGLRAWGRKPLIEAEDQ